MKDLAVVIPVYNEEEAIGSVLDKWVTELDKLEIDYTITPYNDGSKDGSWDVILAKEKEHPGKVIGHNKANSGHGPTILQGYREADEEGYEWIFQIDSDDEMGPEGFVELWQNRNEYDFLVGTRDGRKQALPRKIISAVSRLSVRMFYGQGIWDVNTPYRLMRISAFRDVFQQIPADTFAPNVIISGMAAKLKLRCFETRVPQHDRTTGEVSIKKWKLMKAASRSFFQSIGFAMTQKPSVFSMLFLSGLIAFFPLWKTNSFNEFLTNRICSLTDSSVFLTIANEMLHGALPYRDYFDHKGLYIYFIDALGLLTNMVFIEWFCFALTVLILFLILLLLVRPQMALLLLFLGFLLFRNKYLTSGNMTEEYILPAIAFAIYYFIAFVKRNKTVNYFQTVLLGVSFGWMFMLKFNYISVFVATGLYLLWSLCSKKQYNVLFCTILCGLAGVVLSILPCFFYLWKHNLFSSFYDAYILFNLEYAGGFSFPLNRLYRIIQCPEMLILPWFSGLILATKKGNCDKKDKTIVLFFFAILLLDFVFVWSSKSFYEHYLISMYPLVIVSIALMTKHIDTFILSVLNHLKKYNPLIFGRIIGCLWFVLIILLGLLVLHQLEKRNEYGREYFKDEKVCALLNNHENRIIVIGNTCAYYRLYGATPDSIFLYQTPICDISNRLHEQFAEEIQKKKPHLFLLPSNHTIPKYYENFLQNGYRQEECLNGTLFIRIMDE